MDFKCFGAILVADLGKVAWGLQITLEKLKIYETCNFHVNLDLQDL